MGCLKLGIIEELDDIREVWSKEDKDFTPWVAEEGLELISKAINRDLTIKTTEKKVPNDSFKADVVAVLSDDEDDETVVVIENQYGKSDHDHFGKVLTYSSTLDAKIVIWIAESFTESHKQSIDWLNENTSDDLSFFALEIKLLRINTSEPAPQFNVICSPNHWKKSKITNRNLSDTKLLQQQYWRDFQTYCENSGSFLKLQSPRPRHWYTIAVGRSGFQISLTVNTQQNYIGAEIYIHGRANAKQAFKQLIKFKDEIHNEIGTELDWQELEDKAAVRMRITKEASIKHDSDLEKQYHWLRETAEKLHNAFSPRIKKLKL